LQARHPITLTVTRDGDILVNETSVTLANLGQTLSPLLEGPETKIIVSADAAAPNGIVVQSMLLARQAGAEHFLFAVKRE
jgi:biopolymer transport protein ExbD